MSSPPSTKSLIDGLVKATGAPDAVTAIRQKALEALRAYRAAFEEASVPVNVEALASFLGIPISDEMPHHSKDAELEPTDCGGVEIRVNPDQPETRRRFSIGHEISHTFFPNYQLKRWCRTDARFRRREDPEQFIEMLCDIGAAELLMPNPWFSADVAKITTASGLVQMTASYGVSREAMLRRFAEAHAGCVAALFVSWKLKPSEYGTIGQINQQRLFGDATEEARVARKLRVDYSIPSAAFVLTGCYIPQDKSLKNEGPLYEAASTGQPADGVCTLDFGASSGRYQLLAVPTWTDTSEAGPKGEHAVAAIIRPLETRQLPRNERVTGPTFFD